MYTIKYIKGIPGVIKPRHFNLDIRNHCIELKASRLFCTKNIKINFNDLKKIDFYSESDIIDEKTKDKSVIFRGLIGGALFGILGAILGGVSGIGRKKVQDRKKKEKYFITINYTDGNDEYNAIFEVDIGILKK